MIVADLLPRITNTLGQPYVNATVYFGEPNTDTRSNPIDVYQDEAQSVNLGSSLKTDAWGRFSFNGAHTTVHVFQAYSMEIYSGDVRIDRIPRASGVITDVASSNYTASATGSVSRTIQSRLDDTLSVKGFGAIGDGVADDTVAIQNAITSTLASGEKLYWPVGTYLTTASISNLHEVMSFGVGAVKRGADLFRWEADLGEVNKIYISPTGLDTNDGLSAAEPFLTCQVALEAIQDNQDGVIPGQLEFHMAAGTYTSGFNFDGELRSQRPIYIYGPTQGHPNVPTAIIDGVGDPTGEAVLVRGSSRVRITDIKAINFTNGSAFICNTGKLNLVNCHTDNCRVGVTGLHTALVSISGGDYDGNLIATSVGYQSFYGTTHAIQGTSVADSAKFHHFERGMLLSEGAQGHLDFTIIEDCSLAGMNIKRGSGSMNTKQMQIHRNAIGVLVQDNMWFDNNIDYGIGTANVNTINVKLVGSSPELAYHSTVNESATARAVDRKNIAVHTGTVAQTTLFTSAILPDWGVNSGGSHVSSLRIMGIASLASSVTIRGVIDNGSTTQQIGSIVLTAGVTSFSMDLDVNYFASNAQRGVLRAMGNGGFVEVDYESGSIDLSNVSHTLELTAQLSNGADSITLSSVLLETSLGG